MARAFANIAFTPAVRAAQQRHGSRAAYARFDDAADARDRLGADESAFIAARDGFFQATVGENGWPYVQFRGGQPGFLHVLDERTIGYADFRGNRQYISVGNIDADARVCLLLLDHAAPRRLKLWGRARIVTRDEAPELIARLAMPGYAAAATIERAIVIGIEAYDWNCPQHITRRFSADEVAELVDALRRENESLKSRLDALSAR